MDCQAIFEAQYRNVKKLLALGWSADSLCRSLKFLTKEVLIGSPIFKLLWTQEKSLKSPRELVGLVLDMAGMPLELSGQLDETQAILSHFWQDLAPDDDFWQDFSTIANRAFPSRTISQTDELAQRLHQFRYIISSQQAQYIRRKFKKVGMTDAEALGRFLKNCQAPNRLRKHSDFTVHESARLHNKIKLEGEKIIFPDDKVSYNIKVLLHFHTEFILDSQGNFLNEVDAEVLTESGIINGASFNYGEKGQRHRELDVEPAYVHDPHFRNQLLAGFKAPKDLPNASFKKSSQDFQLSYFNKKGSYSRNGKSAYELVRQEAKDFLKKVR